jgi:FlaA1/EpsC-like NDP-sugar epimerase
MIKLSGADPAKIAVVFTGLRPGEKLYEELLATEEATKPTPHPKLRIAQAREADVLIVGQMVTWCESDRPADDAEVRARLKSWIPEYAPPAGAPIMPLPAIGHDEGRVRKLRESQPVRTPRR